MTAPHTLASEHVARRLAVILRQVLPAAGQPPTSIGSQALAHLRRARPEDLAGSPDTWAYTLAQAPEGLLSDEGEPSAAEAAVHASLVLFARHQQGKGRPMHVAGRGLGSAARELAYSVGGDAPAPAMLTRFQAVGAASSRAQRLHHLGTFITLLRSHDIPLDYARMASDLVLLENPGTARSIRLTWSRDLHRPPAASAASTETDDPQTTHENGASA